METNMGKFRNTSINIALSSGDNRLDNQRL